MTDTIIVSLISFAGTLIGTLGGIVAASKLTIYRIEQLEKKVEKHNSVIERVYKLEKHEAVVDTEIETMGEELHRLGKYHQ